MWPTTPQPTTPLAAPAVNKPGEEDPETWHRCGWVRSSPIVGRGPLPSSSNHSSFESKASEAPKTYFGANLMLSLTGLEATRQGCGGVHREEVAGHQGGQKRLWGPAVPPRPRRSPSPNGGASILATSISYSLSSKPSSKPGQQKAQMGLGWPFSASVNHQQEQQWHQSNPQYYVSLDRSVLGNVTIFWGVFHGCYYQ